MNSSRPYGIRRVSDITRTIPSCLRWNQRSLSVVDYTRRDSTTGLFGGNSNWRGPIWIPINYLIVEAIERSTIFTAKRSWSNVPPVPGR